MEGMWFLSYIVLWFFVILEGLVILALTRQIGFIHLRLGPTGARMMNSGPKIGETAPPLETTDINGQPVTLGVEQGKRSLLVFISSRCQTCKQLLPGLKTLHRTEKSNLRIVLITPTGQGESMHEYVEKYGLDNIPVVISPELADIYAVRTVPYAVLIDQKGEVRAKGLTNNMIHLESLLNADELGHSSIQSFLGEVNSSLGTVATTDGH